MDPPPARACHRCRLPATVPLVPVARRFECRAKTAAVADLWPRRAAGRGRLVDGRLGLVAAGRGFPVSPRDPPGTGAGDLCGRHLDAAADARAATGRGGFATEGHGRGAAFTDLPANLLW